VSSPQGDCIKIGDSLLVSFKVCQTGILIFELRLNVGFDRETFTISQERYGKCEQGKSVNLTRSRSVGLFGWHVERQMDVGRTLRTEVVTENMGQDIV
jgi:hypothetical protein